MMRHYNGAANPKLLLGDSHPPLVAAPYFLGGCTGENILKWFKHDSDAHQDAKLKRVKMKYGMEGYGLYWYCIEMIAGNIDRNHITFELEHDAEIIAYDTGIHYELVQEMMTYMVDQNLFENTNGAITCMKLAKRIDQSMTSDTEFRRIINEIHKNHDLVMIQSRQNQEPSSTDKKIEVRSKKLEVRKKRGKKTSPPSQKNGKTLPKDWTLPNDWKAWTEANCPLVDPEGTAEDFRDWAHGNSNRAIAKKADWFATWRNWCRRDQEKYQEQAKWQKNK